MQRTSIFSILCAAHLALTLTPSRVEAQSRDSMSIILAVADSMPVAGAQAVVMFRSQPSGGHVLLLAPQASPDAIGGALALLERLGHDAPSPDAAAVVAVSHASSISPVSPRRRARWSAYLRDLRSRPRVRLGDAGTGRWMFLPHEDGRTLPARSQTAQ